MNQQLARDVKTIMMQQQCLNAQIQLFMATNNASQNQNFSNNLLQPPNLPMFPAIRPIQPFSLFSAPPIPQTTTQPPVAISPALHSNNDSSNISTSSKTRPKKKKARWVSYEPSSSN